MRLIEKRINWFVDLCAFFNRISVVECKTLCVCGYRKECLLQLCGQGFFSGQTLAISGRREVGNK
jgi:hypothetical protein